MIFNERQRTVVKSNWPSSEHGQCDLLKLTQYRGQKTETFSSGFLNWDSWALICSLPFPWWFLPSCFAINRDKVPSQRTQHLWALWSFKGSEHKELPSFLPDEVQTPYLSRTEHSHHIFSTEPMHLILETMPRNRCFRFPQLFQMKKWRHSANK